VHIDIVDPNGDAVDVAPLLGLPPTARCGPVAERAKARYEAQDRSDPGWRPVTWPPPVGPPIPSAGPSAGP
jgi:hypothetical protein